MDFADPAQQEQWLEDLPLGDVRNTAKVVYHTLHGLNTTQVPLRHHLAFLELIAPTVNNIFRNLEKQYIEAHFPLPEKARTAVRMVDELADLIIRSYNIALRVLSTADLGATEDDPRIGPWSTVAHRILFYSQRILINQRLLDLDPRPHLWQRLFRIHLSSETLKVSKREIGFNGMPDCPSCSIDLMIKRMLLLSLVPLHTLRLNQLSELLNSLSEWAEMLELHRARTEEDIRNCAFHVNLRMNRGPVPAVTVRNLNVCEPQLGLDTTRINEELDQLVSQANADESEKVTTESGLVLSLGTLSRMKEFWNNRALRIEQRTDCTHKVRVFISIPNIYKTLMEREKSEERPSKPPPPDLSSPGMGIPGMTLRSTTSKDPFAASRKVPDGKNGKAYEGHEALVIDQSSSGLRLSLPLENTLKVRVGNLMGIRHFEGECISIGCVRWIREADDGSLTLGLQLLARDPLHAFYRVNESNSEHPCILGEHLSDGNTLLFMNHFPMIRERLITLHIGTETLPISLKGPAVEHSRSFDAFEFCLRPATAKSRNLDPNMPISLNHLIALVRREPCVPSKPPAKGPATDIWQMD